MFRSYIIPLFALFRLSSVECDSSFNHFTVKQCEIDGNCQNDTNSILIAIDGTGSRIYFEETNEPKKYKSQIGLNNNKEWIWQSHIANFWEEYEGTSYYFYGPDANEMIFAAREVHDIIEQSHAKICQFMTDYFALNAYDISEPITSSLIYAMTKANTFGIDIIGYSRGGFAAMEVSRKLQFEGCRIQNNGEIIKPIPVRFMGLYDPVQRDIDPRDLIQGYDDGEIAPNVVSVSIAKRSESIHSRSYFGYAVDSDSHPQDQKVIDSSHGGIGGSPGKGDCKQLDHDNILNWFVDPVAMACSESYTIDLDKRGAIETEVYIRNSAIKAHVPIRELVEPQKYFGDFIDLY